MTREEYRLEQAEFYNDKGVKDPKRHFLRGMEHADSTMIYKACEWLNERLNDYNIPWIENEYCWSKEIFLQHFRKAMEEE